MDHSEVIDDAPLRILCVEDYDPDFELVQEYLRQAPRAPSFKLERAKCVEEACRLIHEQAPEEGFDIILTDLSLPGSKGEATFRAVREAAPGLPIAVMTGLEDDDLGLRLVKEGAQDFLPKDQLSPTFLLRSLLHAIERERYKVKLQKLDSDLKSAQLQLIQAEKLESLGRLSAGVAHEIKNPLAMLQASVDYFKIRGAKDETEETVLRTMVEAIERASRIVNGMLDFSREEQLEISPGLLNQHIRHAVSLIEPELRTSGISLDLDLSNELPRVNLDPHKIEQVIVNLLINAMHASYSGSRIEIRSYVTKVDQTIPDEGVRGLARLRHGDKVVVAEIRDFGGGIPLERMGRIFEPFFTTKATGKGTGLGLSVSKTIVELHGGSLRIANSDPPGVCAQVILRANGAAAHENETESANSNLNNEKEKNPNR